MDVNQIKKKEAKFIVPGMYSTKNRSKMEVPMSPKKLPKIKKRRATTQIDKYTEESEGIVNLEVNAHFVESNRKSPLNLPKVNRREIVKTSNKNIRRHRNSSPSEQNSLKIDHVFHDKKKLSIQMEKLPRSFNIGFTEPKTHKNVNFK